MRGDEPPDQPLARMGLRPEDPGRGGKVSVTAIGRPHDQTGRGAQPVGAAATVTFHRGEVQRLVLWLGADCGGDLSDQPHLQRRGPVCARWRRPPKTGCRCRRYERLGRPGGACRCGSGLRAGARRAATSTTAVTPATARTATTTTTTTTTTATTRTAPAAASTTATTTTRTAPATTAAAPAPLETRAGQPLRAERALRIGPVHRRSLLQRRLQRCLPVLSGRQHRGARWPLRGCVGRHGSRQQLPGPAVLTLPERWHLRRPGGLPPVPARYDLHRVPLRRQHLHATGHMQRPGHLQPDAGGGLRSAPVQRCGLPQPLRRRQ